MIGWIISSMILISSGAYCSDKYASKVCHSLLSVSELGSLVEINDGSVWKISFFDSFKALNWQPDDEIIITQNSRWFSSYAYKIINQTKRCAAEANFDHKIAQEYDRSQFLFHIDIERKEIVLTDRTNWEVSSLDRELLNGWRVGDPIIVGLNSDSERQFEAIIINTALNRFVKAKQK